MGALLHGELHDGVDDVVVGVLEGLDGFLAGDVGLGHDELDVLLLDAGMRAPETVEEESDGE